MISLHVTLYTMDEGDQFKVTTVDEDGNPVDVTANYEVTAVQMEDGRTGWAVIGREEA